MQRRNGIHNVHNQQFVAGLLNLLQAGTGLVRFQTAKTAAKALAKTMPHGVRNFARTPFRFCNSAVALERGQEDTKQKSRPRHCRDGFHKNEFRINSA